MKITFVLPHAGLSGGTRVIAIHAEKLQQKGHDVQVVSLPLPPVSLKQQLKSIWQGKGRVRLSQASHFDGRAVEHHILKTHRPITAADVPDADVVIATWWETAEWVAQFPPSKGAKVYFIQHHETIFPGQPADRVKATWSLPMYKIVVSDWLVKVAKTIYGEPHVSLVSNSVDTTQFFAPPRGKQPIPTVGLMYANLNWKGTDISLQAFSLALEKNPELRLIAFGTGLPDPDLPIPVGTQYVACPPQTSLKDLYAQCDAWLFGSRLEGFGMPILEAMACRTPVIGTPAGAAPGLLKNGAGILVKPEDPVDMANAIGRLSQMTEAEWQAMSTAAYNRAVSYTWNDANKRFEAALQQAMTQSASGKVLIC